MFALVVITLTSLLFVFIGKVNTLGPIVTMPFMLTYAAVDYAYFALAMSYEMKHKRREKMEGGERLLPKSNSDRNAAVGDYGAIQNGYRKLESNGSQSADLDSLFPERTQYDDHRRSKSNRGVTSPPAPDISSPHQPNDTSHHDVSSPVAVGDSNDSAELISGCKSSNEFMNGVLFIHKI